MISKKDLKKINNYLWEIPKTFRRDMLVPARFYEEEKFLDEVFRDKSLEQLVNSTTIPGIIKYAIAMPDMHEGYGVPIGCVFATKLPDGLISPGSVGYDINCLHPDTKVLLEHGAYIAIRDFRSFAEATRVKFAKLHSLKLDTAEAIRSLQRRNSNFLYKITTEDGEKIKVTGDHPLYTPTGMKQAKELKDGDSVLVYPFKGVKYERPSAELIIDRERIEAIMKKIDKGIRGNARAQIINFLKKRDLLSLDYNSSAIPYLLKIIGFIFGDGAISFVGRSKSGVVSFYGKSEDLRSIKADLIRIGFRGRIYSRTRKHSITNNYGKRYNFIYKEHHLKISSTSLAVLLVSLGVPSGRKTVSPYGVPQWILKASRWQQRLFLAAFFGAELSTPSTPTTHGYNFYNLQLNTSRQAILKDEVRRFLNQIREMLAGFTVKSSSVVEVPGYEYKGKGGKTIGLRMQILSNPQNLIKFFKKIGYEHNLTKQRLANAAILYLRFKEKIKKERLEKRKLARQMYAQRVPAAQIFGGLRSKFVPRQFLEHSVWGEKREIPRVAFNFPTFNEYLKYQTPISSGLFWSKIEKIEKVSYQGWVYDLTIKDENHNFIANSFVVSNCGIRLLRSDLKIEDVSVHKDKLTQAIYEAVPSGLGRGGKLYLERTALERILINGAQHLIERGYGEKDDHLYIEEQGKMPLADFRAVSERAMARGRDQLGTLGSGNHFLEIQRVEEIFEPEIAKIFGLFKNQVTFMIHVGSRGLGHQIAGDYMKKMIGLMGKYNLRLPDRELAGAPYNTSEGKAYFAAMSAAANYAFANRQLITYRVREAVKRVLAKDLKLKIVYDITHNMAKVEKHPSASSGDLMVHRKGATRAFPAGAPGIPEAYKGVGQPVLIPGSMGTSSYVLVGKESGREAFYSTCHGAGRQMSRHEAIRRRRGEDIEKDLRKKGILIKAGSVRGIAEEAPDAYKDIDKVVEVVHNAGISKKVAKLVPLAVIKG